MARILYGVMGNTNGHVMRTRAIMAGLPEHEFVFVGGGRVQELLGQTHRVLEVPVLRSVYRAGRLDIGATLGQTLACEVRIPEVFGRLSQLIKEWQPQIYITDREFFLPLFCRWRGLPCLSIDHSHVMRAGRFEIPAHLKTIWRLTLLNDYCLFHFTRHNLITSFFTPPLKAGVQDELFAPVLRPEVREVKPSTGKAIFVYLTTPDFDGLLESLKQQARPVIVYGRKKALSQDGNLTYKPYDNRMIVEDLACCAYAICNAGHNLVSEALYFGKPLYCFPIHKQVEQYLNAWHVRKLGYGDFEERPNLSEAKRMAFEARLPEFTQTIRANFKDGTDLLIGRVREIIAQSSGHVIPLSRP